MRGAPPADAAGDAGDRPFILDNGQIRYLYFSFDFIQSAMRISDPDALDLRYTQKMMAFLLFNPDPRHVAVVGLGGGSIVKFCYRRLPQARVSAVEINARVVAMRDEFCVPRDDARLTIIEGDGADFVAGRDGDLDALLVDAYDRDGIAPTLASRRFIEAARASLAPGGVLVLNLAGNREGFASVVSEVFDLFGNRVLALRVRRDEHHILFAFRDGLFPPDWRQLDARAADLRRRLGLDFPAFLQKLEQAARTQQAWALCAPETLPGFDAEADWMHAGRALAGAGKRRARRHEKPDQER
ncbi:MAG: spermidine synthase-like protein [Betaproteobacteria bacterium]|nr:spermidine synthase-like protein [Betaproteobacteria bacterium]